APLPVRRMAWRAPAALQPRVPRTARVLAVDDEGRVVHDLDGGGPDYHMVTGVRRHQGRVWMSSLEEDAVAWAALD
ncbi:MAG: SMP-30/gluconolactonase/LRE family protein, partial [Nocardioidaceae bacterium]|nr:SMP-30/gluconolactonase/LRE family protein [Nocardioidaceae bacterium]